MEFKKNHELAPLTTFGLPAKARLFAEYSSADELLKISRTPEFTENEVLHIGGGSNLLFVKDFDGLVLHSRNPLQKAGCCLRRCAALRFR